MSEESKIVFRKVGEGKVVLISGGGEVYTDIAARFVKSERELEDIVASPYSKDIVRNILESGHKAALEFDYFLFGVDGYSRVCETQLVRKRMASYMIKSGRQEHHGNRKFDVVMPESIRSFGMPIHMPNGTVCAMCYDDICEVIRQWYDGGVKLGIPEEDLRYLKPQGTVFKGIIGMNAHALYDFFAVRCCMNAQEEIRDMANKMLKLCKEATPDLFANAGPNCVQLGYCPENGRQNSKCKGKTITKNEATELIKQYKYEREDQK